MTNGSARTGFVSMLRSVVIANITVGMGLTNLTAVVSDSLGASHHLKPRFNSKTAVMRFIVLAMSAGLVGS